MSSDQQKTLARVSWMQSMMSRRMCSVSFARALYERCCSIAQVEYSPAAFEDMLAAQGRYLTLMDLEIRTFRDQADGTPIMALVNTKADKLIESATRYSATEIAYIKKLVEEIIRARKEAFSIQSLEAVRLGSKLRSTISRDATEELLRNLVQHQWIQLSQDGIYSLSSRSLLELRQYLHNEFDEHIVSCTHCKDPVTLGLACHYSPTRCGARYHYHCARDVFGSAVDSNDDLDRKAGFPCLVCSRRWSSRPIGPKVWSSSYNHADAIDWNSQSSNPANHHNDHTEDQSDDQDQLNGQQDDIDDPEESHDSDQRDIKPRPLRV
ncbi:hypothetical protein BCV70DRAFT_202279 [Testicularia cyperi]|uniref:Non-structural maintenance of chromosomes element 1 homolog n=1 Tax=Testicularia cyperi TaxID=1882483 RepID=A0A317XIG7_9BASI|nr:hypothetical protein BCV70DRAFT_202279 [Testicularia cyperi]